MPFLRLLGHMLNVMGFGIALLFLFPFIWLGKRAERRMMKIMRSNRLKMLRLHRDTRRRLREDNAG